MSKAIYVGVDNKARKVKSLYVGVDGKARKVKKGYIGVNGVARLFYAPVDRPPRLPSGYDELEYIYTDPSTYSQYAEPSYIDTLIGAKSTTKLILRAQVLSMEDSFVVPLISSSYVYSSSAITYSARFNLDVDRSGIMNASITTYEGVATPIRVASNLYTPFEITMQGDGNIILNGLHYKDFGILHSTIHAAQLSNILLGVKPIYGIYARDYRPMRFTECLIYDGDELQADLIACKNAAGMVGMYDVVRESLFTSASTSQFLAGPKIY